MQSTYAVLMESPRQIALRKCSLEPHEDEVLVKIRACAICQGDLTQFLQARTKAEAFGHEPVGEVVACGPWVRGLKVGDWVVGNTCGGFSDYALGHASGPCPFYRVPDKFRELGEYGALAEPIKCVTTTVRAAATDYEDTVVVMGCGFMGLATIAALANGWHRQLIAVELDPTRQNLAREFGATHVVASAADDAIAQVLDLTEGQGAHVVIDFAGRQEATDQAARMLRTRGKLVTAGGFLPQQDCKFNLYLKGLTIHTTPPCFSPNQADDWQRTIEAMARGRYPLARLVTHRHSLRDIQTAFETALGSARKGYIKGIVVNG